MAVGYRKCPTKILKPPITLRKIVKMPDDPPLMNGQNGESVSTWLHNIHELIYSVRIINN